MKAQASILIISQNFKTLQSCETLQKTMKNNNG